MAQVDPTDSLRKACHQSYEKGRIVSALVGLWPVPLMLIASLLLGGHMMMMSLGAATLLTMFGFYTLWRGGAAAEAWRPGLLAACVPLVLPFIVHLAAKSFPNYNLAPGSAFCLGVCVTGGLVLGGWVGMRARLLSRPGEFLAASIAVGVTGGLLGCAAAGYGGVIGLAAGMILGAGPVVVPSLLGQRT